MQEQLQKLAVSKQEVLHCLGIVGAGFLYSLGINLFVVPAGLYTGGIMGFAQLLRTLFLHVTGLELKIDIAGIINYAINLPILCIAWRRAADRSPRGVQDPAVRHVDDGVSLSCPADGHSGRR